MTGNELMRRLKALAKARQLALRYDARHGKGSHGRLWLGEQFTTLKDPRHDIGPGLLRKMLRDLGFGPEDLT